MEHPSKSKSIERLRRLVNSISELQKLESFSPEFEKWKRNTQVAIERTFGNRTNHLGDFNAVSYSLSVFSSNTPDSRFQEAYVDGLEHAKSILDSMIEEIEEYWEDDDNQEATNDASRDTIQPKTKDVFIVHGRDDGTKEMVARYIEKLGLTPVILHEQPNQGRTVIEKLENNASRVAFALILLTPDDEGSISGEKKYKPRARQNVILELGFFMGKIGRNRVCALRKGNIEIPSDYHGVVYIQLENEEWKLRLVQEFKTAGLEIDANLAFGEQRGLA